MRHDRVLWTCLFVAGLAFGITGTLAYSSGDAAPARAKPARPLADWWDDGRIEFIPPPRPVESLYSIPPGEEVPLKIESDIRATSDVPDWGHDAIGVPDAWRATKGKGAVVAVLDTGVDLHHKDLDGRIKIARNFTSSRNGVADVQGHGTWCAGCVAASLNDWGVVGVAPECLLVIGKVLGDNGSGSSSGIAAGIDWAVDQGADVISMSLGGPGPDSLTKSAVQRATAKGVIVVCAAGNEGPRDGTVGYPGGYPESIAVAAVDSSIRVASFSSRGKNVFVAAPGVNCRSTYPGNRFASMSGTSMATPYVAGVAALYVADCKARGTKPTPAEFRSRVQASARDLPPTGRDTASGYGLIQPGKMLGAPKPTDPPGKMPDPPTTKVPFLYWDDLTPEAQKRFKR